MTQEEFIEVLDDKGYPYEIVGDKIVVTNEDTVYLNTLTSLPPGVEFGNGGYVGLRDLTSIPPGVVFENGEDVWLKSFISGRDNKGYFGYWEGNIEGIDSKRLLNLMIKQGVFER